MRIHPCSLSPVPIALACAALASACAGPPHQPAQPAPAAAQNPSDLVHGAPAAQVAYGERLLVGDGSGTGIDESHAAVWFTRAADQHDPLGQTRLADCLLTGKGIPIDPPRALALYRQAADTGLPEAQYSLGVCLSEGRGTPGGRKDLARAVRLWTFAADGGFAPAQFRLALHLKSGEGVSAPDAPGALMWFQRAAAQGHVAAQANLGRCLLRGEGAAKDNYQAYMWSTVAMNNGAALAKRTCDAAAKELSPEQIAGAKKEAAGFTARPEAQRQPRRE